MMASAWIACFGLLLLLPGAVWSVTKDIFRQGVGKNGIDRASEADKRNYRDMLLRRRMPLTRRSRSAAS